MKIRKPIDRKPQSEAIVLVAYEKPQWKGMVDYDQVGTTKDTVRLIRLDTKEKVVVYWAACHRISC